MAAPTATTICAGRSAGCGCAATPTFWNGGSKGGPTPSPARSIGCARCLHELGYLADDRVTPAGRQLSRVYSEADLVVVECLREGIWDELSAPELAAAVSALVFESRGDRVPSPTGEPMLARMPAAVRSTLARMVRLWSRLDAAETEHRLDFLREPDPGFAWAAHQWACGVQLEGVLDEELTAGDFVRWTRQLIDLLDQVADVGKGARRRHRAGSCRRVASRRRGVLLLTFQCCISTSLGAFAEVTRSA